jgi:hypothetical protein
VERQRLPLPTPAACSPADADDERRCVTEIVAGGAGGVHDGHRGVVCSFSTVGGCCTRCRFQSQRRRCVRVSSHPPREKREPHRCGAPLLPPPSSHRLTASAPAAVNSSAEATPRAGDEWAGERVPLIRVGGLTRAGGARGRCKGAVFMPSLPHIRTRGRAEATVVPPPPKARSQPSSRSSGAPLTS